MRRYVLPGPKEAKLLAVRAAHEIAAEDLRSGRSQPSFRIEVLDEHGAEIAIFRMRDS